ncbi:ATP-binding protein [bacterium]|nr:ATP-binding protein [bacterium]
MRRRLRNSLARKMKNVSREDCICAAYYLYCVSELYEGKKCPTEDSVELFCKLVTFFGKTAEVAEFLEKHVRSAEKTNLLEPLTADTERYFEDSKIRYRYREDRDIERNLAVPGVSLTENLVNLYRCFYASNVEYRFFARLIANFLLRRSCTENFSLLEKIPGHVEKVLFDKSLTGFISDSVNVTDSELRYLALGYRCAVMPALNGILDDLFHNGASKQEFVTKVLGISSREYRAITDKNGALYSFGFINDYGDVEDEAIRSIETGSLEPFFADFVKNEEFSNTYELNSFNVGDDTTTIMQGALSGKGSFMFLLYGKPGSGKTEYAKALAKASGLKTFVFKNEEEPMHNSVLYRMNLFLSINHPGSIVVVDEADTLLKTIDFGFFGPMPSRNKGIINKMLENNKNKVIWIVNHTKQIDTSTRRRFNFSCKFTAMPKEQLRKIALSKLAVLNIDENLRTRVLKSLEKYNVTGSSVDNVVKTIENLESIAPAKLESCINKIFDANSALLCEGTKKSKMRDKTKSGYDLHALNTSVSPDSIVEMIHNAEEFARSNDSSEKGIRLLFYGLSGTGKTEFARYIAEKLDKKILIKRASDLLDKYVGETEKKIAEAFEEAEESNSILLLDEADSFFRNRENASQSWEITKVNEFLTQMEEFDGIFICTTNLRKIMDPAMNRRFHAIVEFKPLEREGIAALLKSYFGKYDFSDSDVAKIADFDSAAPGDFGVLAQKLRFMKQSSINSAFIVEELCRIQSEKDNGNRKTGKIGYCA